MKRTAMISGPLMALAFFAAGTLCASTIDSFTFTPDNSSPFTTSLTDLYTNSQAMITGTIACESTTTCSGAVGNFNLGLDLTDPSMLSITSDGNLSGNTAGSGAVDLLTPVQQTRDFTVPLGSFDHTRYTDVLPALGMLDVTGSMDLTLQPGQVLTLPVTIGFAGGVGGDAVPEPSGQVLLVVAALGLAGFVRYRYSQRAS